MKRRKFFQKKAKAFTLIELVIVIAILAILIAIALPKFQETNVKAQITAHNANVRAIENAAILYLSDHPETEKISMTQLEGYLNNAEKIKPFVIKDKQTKTEFIVEVKNDSVTVIPGIIEDDKK